MSRERKYTGGSKVVSFRLPVIGYDEAMARVNDLLNTIAIEGNAMQSEAFTDNDSQSIHRYDVESITYQCGCSNIQGKHVKALGCRIAIVDH
jgi:hypothetical protein